MRFENISPLIEVKDFDGRFTRVFIAGIDVSQCVNNVSYSTDVTARQNGHGCNMIKLEINIFEAMKMLSELSCEEIYAAKKVFEQYRQINKGTESR